LPTIGGVFEDAHTIANPIESIDFVDVIEESEVCVIGLAQFFLLRTKGAFTVISRDTEDGADPKGVKSFEEIKTKRDFRHVLRVNRIHRTQCSIN
jgi:hypothetical protein